jgi:hypothetical protein
LSASAELAALRTRYHLPVGRFIFACFNAMNKLDGGALRAWARILVRAPHAVLVLLDPQTSADSDVGNVTRANIRAEFDRHGAAESISTMSSTSSSSSPSSSFSSTSSAEPLSARILFAARLPLAAHLERLGAVDLALDSFPYGAHTTAADALWAGAPVLTWPQRRFAGRVAAAQLFATGCVSKMVNHANAQGVASTWASEVASGKADEEEDAEAKYAKTRAKASVRGSDSDDWAVLIDQPLAGEGERTAARDERMAALRRPSESVSANAALMASLQSPATRAFLSHHDRDTSNPATSMNANESDSQAFVAAFPYFRTVDAAHPLPAHVVDFAALSAAPHARLAVASAQQYEDTAVFLAFHSEARLAWRACLEVTLSG